MLNAFRILSDCSCGPPLTIDWDFDETSSFDVDSYESCRPPRRLVRQMIMNDCTRSDIIINSTDYTTDDINKVIKEMDLVKKQRQRTRTFLSVMHRDDSKQKAKKEGGRTIQRTRR